MRPTSARRFVIFGAVGFALGWIIAGLFNVVFEAITSPMYGPGTELPPEWVIWLPDVAYFIAGALGGAALGLAIGGWKRLVALTLAGSVGVGLSSFFFFIMAMLFVLNQVGMAMGVGLSGGVALGLASGDWKRVVALGLAGMLGFGIGGAVAAALRVPFVLSPYTVDLIELWQTPWMLLRHSLVQVMVGIFGGAALGVALGYLEKPVPFAEGGTR